MENPVYTFATPTIISGDRANVDVIAHELAHSWSGNLVSNASWEHLLVSQDTLVIIYDVVADSYPAGSTRVGPCTWRDAFRLRFTAKRNFTSLPLLDGKLWVCVDLC